MGKWGLGAMLSSNKNKIVKHKASPFLRHPAPQAAESFPFPYCTGKSGDGQMGIGSDADRVGSGEGQRTGNLA